jgi:hypothetical protein
MRARRGRKAFRCFGRFHVPLSALVGHDNLCAPTQRFDVPTDASEDLGEGVGLVEIAKRVGQDSQEALALGRRCGARGARDLGLGRAHGIGRAAQLPVAFAGGYRQQLLFQALEDACVLFGRQFEDASDALVGGLRHYAHIYTSRLGLRFFRHYAGAGFGESRRFDALTPDF